MGKIKKVVELMVGEGFHSSDDEFLVNVAFAFAHTVDLTDRDSHRHRKLGQVAVVTLAELKDPRPYYQAVPQM